MLITTDFQLSCNFVVQQFTSCNSQLAQFPQTVLCMHTMSTQHGIVRVRPMLIHAKPTLRHYQLTLWSLKLLTTKEKSSDAE